MSAGGSAPLWRNLLFVFFLLVSSVSDQKHITAESGHSVTLPCRAPNDDITITAVEWTRTDLKNEYVFFYRNKGFDPANQHPSFKDRVDLQDRQMKDGDVSLILKDVTTADSGTYECRVAQRKTNEEIATLNLISIIYLHVDPPGQTGVSRGHAGLVAALSLFAVIAALVIFIKLKPLQLV
ncbi:coxsackievirus and adenovirus receptor homolog [Simochromis diagramma]|uniref:coxsackievirus and adenovirus receptor homolog n=1 Tax=Simochromis diagramma TaxID=43689 RepID=UPI001A7EBB1F|nr:coxsackievirus and adenovirus receptor homolog [Simochromis diagramma]